MRRTSTLLLAGLLAALRPALAGPPFITDDPEPVDFGHHEFYIASQQVKTQDGRSGTLPHFEFNYGFATDAMVHVLLPNAFNVPAGGSMQSGPGDVELGMKYRFLHETSALPEAAVFPLVEVPAGDASRGLGNGATQFFLPLWLQKNWGSWQSYGGGGYWINRAAGMRNHWFFGWVVQHDLNDHLTLGAELYHNGEQAVGIPQYMGFNLGGQYNFDEHDHLLFSLGRGLSHVAQTDQLTSYVAYQWTW
ncbi:hypothetical protein [Thiomonas sp. FB-Cd]|uniref:hypothetical protein n=1 Tax=Thiomonas sp. FB-Cd TaxID=1158292 RepID=UPI0004DF6A7C|nr:hypothetical protein [Thiomonas sp. FB-Cd]